MNESTWSKLVGLYWYCYDFHRGQTSWQYRVLSTSKYKPSSSTNNIYKEDEESLTYYTKLVNKFER